MALNITITDAGRNEIINAQADGTAPVTITEIAVGSGQYTPDATQTSLQSEIKRIASVSGTITADDTIHVVLQDESSDAYSLGEFGLYTDSGTLFAVYSQTGSYIADKSASATLLIANDIVLDTLDAGSLTFGELTFVNPAATTTVKGVVELADNSEALAGTDDDRAMTPVRVHEAFQQYGLGVLLENGAGDPDSIQETQFYQSTNGRAGDPFDGSKIIHIGRNFNGQAAQIAFQNAFDNTLSGKRSGFRTKLSGNWGPWYEYWHTGNVGSGSGLDADRLDGQEGAYYRNASNIDDGTLSDARLPSTISSNTTGNAATATDADRLDGLDSSQFLRKDSNEEYSMDGQVFSFVSNDSLNRTFIEVINNGVLSWRFRKNNEDLNFANVSGSGEFLINGQPAWYRGNTPIRPRAMVTFQGTDGNFQVFRTENIVSITRVSKGNYEIKVDFPASNQTGISAIGMHSGGPVFSDVPNGHWFPSNNTCRVRFYDIVDGNVNPEVASVIFYD